MRKVLIIYTGGTIGMAEDSESGALVPLNFEHLSSQIPELKKFDIKLSVRSFPDPIDSSNMSPGAWVQIAEMIRGEYHQYDGFVILHGTDTMAYTAAALSFMLENLSKPVILTGSQLPIGTLRTDGKENLVTAIEIAGAQENGVALVPEVAIYFEYRLLRGNRTRKYNTEHFDAFQSPNYPVLAEAGIHIQYNRLAIRRPGNGQLIVHNEFESGIFILKLFPGIRTELIRSIAESPVLKGLVLETFGAGNAMTDPAFIAVIMSLTARGIPVMDITQCYGGAVMLGRYETSVQLRDAGVISGADISTEAAVTKMMLLLGRGLRGKELEAGLKADLAGEITV